ncbi:MAG: hypothetical protein ABW034_13405 [Steroidobacteraceae bacterium]
MIRHPRFALLCASFLLGACATTPKEPAAPATPPAAVVKKDVSGTWEVTSQTQMGERTSSLVLSQAGDTLSGSMQGDMGDMPITGTVAGDDVAFSMTVSAMGQDLKIDYSGKLAGDTISGKIIMGSYGEGTFTAKKKS